ncbi:unnamed protein product [Gongylonema pulchrum]|uniref:Uncharacterized protein n=1 Tax=Gongylonema pulchrum TaxID=637853 RepID=A0A183EKY0_9BILA|nr:unnamed protein product [Gongylonema pulchrum]
MTSYSVLASLESYEAMDCVSGGWGNVFFPEKIKKERKKTKPGWPSKAPGSVEAATEKRLVMWWLMELAPNETISVVVAFRFSGNFVLECLEVKSSGPQKTNTAWRHSAVVFGDASNKMTK